MAPPHPSVDNLRASAAVVLRQRSQRIETRDFGPLTLMWTPSSTTQLHSESDAVCLLVGSVYDIVGADRSSLNDAANTVLRLYLNEKERALQRLRGDYWLVLFDQRSGRGLVACDHIGAYSPHWAAVGESIIVASDLDVLVPVLPRLPEPDPVAIVQWLGLNVAAEGRTFYDGVRRLPSGSMLRIGAAELTPVRYWCPQGAEPLRVSAGEATERIRTALDIAVARCCDDGTPTGLFLSGGLDSSAVAGLATAAGVAVRAYSTTFPEHPSIDESALIDATTSALKMPSTRVAVKGARVMAAALDYTARWLAPPTSPNNYFWNPLTSRAAADGVRVVLDGELGDTVFGAVPVLLSDLLRRGRFREAVRLTRELPGSVDALSGAVRRRRIRRLGFEPALPRPVLRWIGRQQAPPSWLRPEWQRVWRQTVWTDAWFEHDGPRWQAWFSHDNFLGPGPAVVFEQTRRRGASWGLLTRHPLGDVDLLELMLRLPPQLAFDRRWSRPQLRRATEGLVPDVVRLRPDKSNFDAPYYRALAGPELKVVSALVDAPDARVRAYIQPDVVHRELFADGPPTEDRGRQRWAARVWRLMTAECWLRLREDSSSLAEARAACEPSTLVWDIAGC